MIQSESEKLFEEFLRKGRFYVNSKEYSWDNWREAVEVMIPDDRKMKGKICFISSLLTLTNRDLNTDFHEGFTIGNGKKLYWMMIWHNSGNVTVIPADANPSRRWLSGDTEITVHFKPKQ